MKYISYENMRAKGRFNVNLKGTYRLKDQGRQHQECRITNLSPTGATARFKSTESITNNIPVLIDISIPKTIMHVSTEAEIVWVKQRFNELICGVRFINILSETMIQKLIAEPPEGGPPRG
jgi:hypothetical protein